MGEAEQLTRAQRAYDVGDFAEVRRVADALRDAEDPAIRSEARRLLTALSPDLVEAAVIATCLLALLAIVWRYLL